MSTNRPIYGSTGKDALSIAVVCACYNPALVESLLERVINCLKDGSKLNELLVERVPGSHELPSCIDLILQRKDFDCVVALGVVIKGSTNHHHLVAEATTQSLQGISLQYHIPVINGLIVTDDIKSAEERIIGDMDRGYEFAKAALHMAGMKKRWTST